MKTIGLFLAAGLAFGCAQVDSNEEEVGTSSYESRRDGTIVIRDRLRVVASYGDEGIGPAGGFSNVEACDHNFDRAKGKIKIKQRNGKTRIKVKIRNAVPNEYYTVWAKLDGVPSPITGIPSTPLISTTEIPYMETITPPNAGSTIQQNGFFTDSSGRGQHTLTVDFPLLDMVYPFPSGDVPLADVPWTVALASHCTDHTGHGMVAGAHENTFRWP